MGAISAAGLQEIGWAAYTEVLNRRDPYVYDRYTMPWLGMLEKRKKTITGMGGKVQVKVKTRGGLVAEHWEARDVLTFRESRIDFQLEFPLRRTHIGLEILHSELENEGYTVTPNEKRGKSFPNRISAADVGRLVDIYEEKIDDMMNEFDETLDRVYLLDGSQDSQAPVGLFGYLTLNPAAGTIGGQSRVNKILQHNVVTGSTVTAGGTLARDLNTLIRESNRYNRGFPGRIDGIMAGNLWIDGYVDYARANGIQFNTELGDKKRGVDIGLPDSGITFQGLPVVHNPTFDELQDQGFNPGFNLRKCAVLLNSQSWALGIPPDKFKHFSAPMDPPDQRFTRLSLDHRGVLIPKRPNGNALNVLA